MYLIRVWGRLKVTLHRCALQSVWHSSGVTAAVVAVIFITAISATVIIIIVNTTPHHLTLFLNRGNVDICRGGGVGWWLFTVPSTAGCLAFLVPWLLFARNNHLPKHPSPVGSRRTTPGSTWAWLHLLLHLPSSLHFLCSSEQNWTRWGFSHSARDVAPLETPICTSPSGHLVSTPLGTLFWYLLFLVSIYWSLIPLYHSWTLHISLWRCALRIMFTLCERFSIYVFAHYS